MIVDVDIGNSFIKWRVKGESSIQRQATAALAQGWRFDSGAVERIRLACVAGKTVEQDFVREVLVRWGVKAEVAKVARSVGGVVPAYEDLFRLGVDRWLASLTAYGRVHGACAVVSAGSAITADWLGQNGQHLGGYIVPGYQRLQNTLVDDVADVLREPLQKRVLDSALGGSTESCVSGGIAAMLAGFMSHVVTYDPMCPIFLAGGDAAAMFSLCAQEHKTRVHMLDAPVLDGLAIALP